MTLVREGDDARPEVPAGGATDDGREMRTSTAKAAAATPSRRAKKAPPVESGDGKKKPKSKGKSKRVEFRQLSDQELMEVAETWSSEVVEAEEPDTPGPPSEAEPPLAARWRPPLALQLAPCARWTARSS